MKSDNELIAEFMGFVQKSYTKDSEKLWCDNKHGLPVGELKFDTSWDWLMPVVEKIEKLYQKAFPTNEVFIQKILAHEDPIEKEYIDVISTSICTPISEVYEVVVKFIKWYNETYAGSVPA